MEAINMNKNQANALSLYEEIFKKYGEKATRQEIQEVVLSRNYTKGQLMGLAVYMKWAERESKKNRSGNPQGETK
jgi:hypothetical protein